MGDAGQIQQALMNLALNAGDAMGETGTLTIRAATIAPEYFKKRFMFESPVPFVAVSVSDTGTGMEESMIAQIFDPYFTTKDKGTGLGLAIVHGIVKNHNGFIDVESTPGIGSTFTLYFPTVTRADDAAPAQETQQPLVHGESILVVDDEVLLRDTLKEYLGNAGYRIATATNGIEALEYFKVHYNSIDLVITDLGMPEMGGEELYRVLHKIDPTLKVIITSGYLNGFARSQLLQMGVKNVLTKPYRMREIKRIVRAVLNGES
jgi:CheY-like chemotaxis protein